MIKPRTKRWMGHVARVRRSEILELWLENLKGRNHFEDIDVDGRVILI
jgi:hypothetical protein